VTDSEGDIVYSWIIWAWSFSRSSRWAATNRWALGDPRVRWTPRNRPTQRSCENISL